MDIGELLKQYRTRANKTQKEWVGTIISPSFYSKVEQGANHIVTNDLLDLLDYNNILPEQFFNELRPKRQLEYEFEQELRKLMSNAYYQNSTKELERLKQVIEQGNLPNKNNLLLIITGVIALATNNSKNLDQETISIIKNRIFSVHSFDKYSLRIYCSSMRLYDIDSNILLTHKILKQLQNSTDVDIQNSILAIITNLMVLCIEDKRYDAVMTFVKVADSIKIKPELCFCKSVFLIFKNLINFHYTNQKEYLEACQKGIDFLSFIGMSEYSKNLTEFVNQNK